jgi:hypothetical protein
MTVAQDVLDALDALDREAGEVARLKQLDDEAIAQLAVAQRKAAESAGELADARASQQSLLDALVALLKQQYGAPAPPPPPGPRGMQSARRA